jgi:hypothetical protein
MLWRAGLTRDRLDRSHPLLRRATRLTWFPLDGHRAATEDVRGVASNSSTVAWDPDPVLGRRFRIESNQTITTGITASQMGINGSNTPWTCIWAHAHWANLVDSGGFLFTLGDNGNGNNIEANARSTGVRLGNWEQYALVNPGLQTSPDHTKTCFCVVSYNGAFTIHVRAFNPHINGWEGILSASTPSTNNNLSDGKAFRFADNTAGANGHSAWTSLGFWGMFAGVAWSADEAREFLLNPERLWSPRLPIIIAPAAATGGVFNDTLTDSLTAGDGFAAVATLQPAIVETVTGADQVNAAAVFVGASSETVTAADALAASGILAPTISDALTAGDGFSAVATLGPALAESVTAGAALDLAATMAAGLSDGVAAADSLAAVAVMVAALGEGVTAADVLFDALDGGGNTFDDSLSDAVTAGDSAAVVMLAGVALAQAVTASDALGAALGVVVAFADAVHPLDAYSAGDIGISEARVWRVTARPRVSPVLARSRVWRVPPPRRGG